MRSQIQDFILANPIYRNSSVTFYTVVGGAKSPLLATLYKAKDGLDTIGNPQKLSSDGRFLREVWIDQDVIAEITGTNTPSHLTGVIPFLFSSGDLVDLAQGDGGSYMGLKHIEAGAVLTDALDAYRKTAYRDQFDGFPSIKASRRKIRYEKGLHTIDTNTIIDERVEIEGESRAETILEGVGDLFNLTESDSSMWLTNCTLQNDLPANRGTLIKVSYNGEIAQSVFEKVHFKTSHTHIDTDRGFGPSFVDWILRDCRCIDADVVSRKYGAAWVLLEEKVYTWFCNRGIDWNGNISTATLLGNTFELNTSYGMKFDVKQFANIIGFLMEGGHFEANGTIPSPAQAISIDGFAATAIIRNMVFRNVGSFGETVGPTVLLPNPNNITQFGLDIDNCPGFTTSDPYASSVWTSSDYRTGFHFKSAASVKRIVGSFDGNSVAQITNQAVAIGEYHDIYVYANQTGVGSLPVEQRFSVWRDVLGAMHSNIIFEQLSGGYGVDIVLGAGVYTIRHKPAMPQTYHGRYIIDKV